MFHLVELGLETRQLRHVSLPTALKVQENVIETARYAEGLKGVGWLSDNPLMSRLALPAFITSLIVGSLCGAAVHYVPYTAQYFPASNRLWDYFTIIPSHFGVCFQVMYSILYRNLWKDWLKICAFSKKAQLRHLNAVTR